MALTPSCAEDFTPEWVLFVMQQYFEHNFGCTVSRIGGFHAERADLASSNMHHSSGGANDSSSNTDGAGEAKRTSQHLLSQV